VSKHQAEVAPMRCTERTLLRLLRGVEDLIVENALSALVLEGRCPDGESAGELTRYYESTAAVRHRFVFSCGSSCARRTWTVPTFPNSSVLERHDFHDVDLGPFLLVVDPRFSGLIASARMADGRDDGSLPVYDMVWTFDPNVVFTALEYLVARVAAQHSDSLAEFERHVRENAPSSASLRLSLNFTTKLATLLQRQSEMEYATSRVSALVNETFDIDEILQGAADQLVRSLGVRRVALGVWGETRPVPEAFHESLAQERSTLEVGDALDDVPPPVELPIASHGKVFGVLTVEDDTPGRAWCEEELSMLGTVARHLGTGISHARLFKRMREQAITDDLTGLYNKRHFLERLEREMEVAERSAKPLSIVLLDLDNLKSVNDTHGHLAGDAVIRHVGSIISGHVRMVDIAARFGGEEFVVILPFTDLDKAILAAERLRRAIAEEWLETVGTVTASVGVTTYTKIGSSPTDLLEEADRAMYAAKASGRNRVMAFGARREPPDTPGSWLRDGT
jgi:diguanylate cyclase (GGDEF)-like protein